MRGAPEFRFKVLAVPKGRNCPKSSDEMVIEIGNVGNKRRSALFCFHVGELLIFSQKLKNLADFISSYTVLIHEYNVGPPRQLSCFITPISLWYMIPITIVFMGCINHYKPTFTSRGGRTQCTHGQLKGTVIAVSQRVCHTLEERKHRTKMRWDIESIIRHNSPSAYD